jgi:threonine dehydrogenase-like Zn-dependent dehydrogenase
MRALVWHDSKDVRVEERPMPLVGAAGDAVIRVTRSAICGSDLHIYHHDIPLVKEGDVLGWS